jgi:hypothetical protein
VSGDKYDCIKINKMGELKMISILYILLIYTLLGSVVYLIAQHQIDKELTHFKEELFLFLGFIFKPIITVILLIDGYLLPLLKQKRTIRYIKKQYNRQLKNDNLTEEQRQEIIHKRDAMVEFISNVGSETDYDEE